MIPRQRRLLNRLENCVWVDSKESSVIRINFESVLETLYEFELKVPPVQYEAVIQEKLNEMLVGKLPANPTAIKIIVGKILFDISGHMAISEKDLLRQKLRLEERS